MSKVDCAVQCFNNGYNCSQAIFSTYCEELGLERDLALKLSCGLGGGMGRMADTCGAVTGAYLLIGLKHGKYRDDDNLSKETTYELVRKFSDKFKEINGSTMCRDLLGYDMNTEEGLAYVKEHELWNKLCPTYIKDASLIIEELLELK